MDDINAILNERGKRYGEFSDHAEITQNLKAIMMKTDKWFDLNASQKEALDMIAHKIGRILNDDPNYADSWIDIAGYATLVAKDLSARSTRVDLGTFQVSAKEILKHAVVKGTRKAE